MEKLLEILQNSKPNIDFTAGHKLIDERILDSLDVITIVSEIDDEFDVEIGVNEIVPENFNSVEAIFAMITRLQND